MRILGENDRLPQGSTVATIGMFDGVHRGHVLLIDFLKQQAAASGKQSLASREEREVAYLTDAEAQLYALLCDPTHKGHRRIEQERIPLGTVSK